MRKELANFWWNHNIIILEWEKENNWKLIREKDEEISLITFTYYDNDFGSLRFVGDGYYHPNKKRHVAVLWPAGHTKNALEKSCK
ncbi:MAG: hypothetical protein mread185_000657 [Mycoplasmataceae bacterium]|nr:MAG: hypothetical protein mread185_000657 [Mycoplasmataceae bacterium]